MASRLASADLPDWAHVVDYGIRGMHLAYDLAGGYDSAILIDATPRGGAPGTIYVIEPDLDGRRGSRGRRGRGSPPTRCSTRTGCSRMSFSACSACSSAETRQVLVVGCEPASVDYGIGLSEPVAAAVDEAVRVVLDLVVRRGGVRRGAPTSHEGVGPCASGFRVR